MVDNKGMRGLPAALAALLLGLGTLTVCGAGEEAGYSVRAVIPDNQMDGGAPYFDLLAEAGSRQELTLMVENQGDREITVTVEAVTATTNRNGIINYSSPGIADETMPFSFADLVEIPEKEITIPPFEAVEATALLELPQEEFRGMALGSLRVVKALEEDERLEGAGVVNQYSYAVAVRLRESLEEIQPEFALDEAGYGLVNYKAAVTAYLRNTQPVMVENLTALARVYGEAGELLLEKRQENVSMAPNSVFPMALVDQEGLGIGPGGYTVSVELEHGGLNWQLEAPLNIEPEAADEVNGGALNQSLPEQESGAFPLLAAVLLTLGGSGILFLFTASLYLKKRAVPQ